MIPDSVMFACILRSDMETFRAEKNDTRILVSTRRSPTLPGYTPIVNAVLRDIDGAVPWTVRVPALCSSIHVFERPDFSTSCFFT